MHLEEETESNQFWWKFDLSAMIKKKKNFYSKNTIFVFVYIVSSQIELQAES